MSHKAKLALVALLAVTLVLVPLVAYAQTVVDGDIGDGRNFYYPNHRKSFHAAGRYWVVYADSVNGIYYTSSTTGDSFESPVVITAVVPTGDEYGLHYDGSENVVHIVWLDSPHIRYRAATPESDGTLTWLAAQQTAATSAHGAPTALQTPTVSTDSNGYPWIEYREYWYSGGANYDLKVSRSDNKDGSWSTTSGFPDILNSYVTVAIVGLTEGRMAAFYSGTSLDSYLNVKRWTGVGWGSQVSTNEFMARCSLVPIGDDVYAFGRERLSSGDQMFWSKYSYSTNTFTSCVEIYDSADEDEWVTATLNADQDIWLFRNHYSTNKIWAALFDTTEETLSDWYEWVDDPDDLCGQFEAVLGSPVESPDVAPFLFWGASYNGEILKFKGLDDIFGVTTVEPDPIGSGYVWFKGSIDSLSFGNADERGFEFFSSADPTIYGVWETGDFGVGAFTLYQALGTDESWYVRAYAVNDYGVSYGEWMALLAVHTLAPTNIGQTTVTLNGRIGIEDEWTERGFEYGHEEMAATWTVNETGTFGNGTFSADIEDLEIDALYFYRAYATANETDYGDWVGFLTAQADYELPDDDVIDDGIVPDIPDEPDDWYVDPSFDDSTIPGFDFLNEIFGVSGFPVSFFWYLLIIAVTLIGGLIAYAFSRHTFVVLCTSMMLLCFFASLQWLDWWMLFPMILVGLTIITIESRFAI